MENVQIDTPEPLCPDLSTPLRIYEAPTLLLSIDYTPLQIVPALNALTLSCAARLAHYGRALQMLALRHNMKAIDDDLHAFA